MADPGHFIAGFIGVGSQIAINEIIHHINIALCCNKELASLKNLVMSVEPIITQIQKYRLELNMKKGISTYESKNTILAVNRWLKKLDELLQQASRMVQQCTIPRCAIISRYQTSKRITSFISNIDSHLKLVPVIVLAQTQELLLGQSMQIERVEAGSTSSCASTSGQAIAPTAGFFIQEALIVGDGQNEAFARVHEFVMYAEREGKSLFRIGVVGKGGSGKTLLLKRAFNSKKVRDLFHDKLLLWLTVSALPSFTHLRNELCKQIAAQAKVDLDSNMNNEDTKIWLSEGLQRNSFALFLDDVWGGGAKLLEELGILRLNNHSNSIVIVSSRDHRALLEMGVADKWIITMKDLKEDESWQLFANHAFPYNKGNLPANINEKMAKLVCARCDGLPLAIKVIGRALASTTHPQEWEFAFADSHGHPSSHDLYDSLRLSYDALGKYDVNLQLCFLYAAAAFAEDQIIDAECDLIQLWIGEGLLTKKKPQDDQPWKTGQWKGYYDPLEIGRIYVDLLADRCLIEPIMRDIDGRVLCFRIHDVLRDLAIQIAEGEENFYCRVGRHMTVINENESLGCTRLLLNANKLRSLPESFRGPEIRSLLLRTNKDFTKISKKVLGSMISLKVLDLSKTSLHSLPESVGYLKQLVCLRLAGMFITRLPESLTNLVSLQILDLSGSCITKLPFGLHKLRSLQYLGLHLCNDLQYLPYNISRLPSLQYLEMDDCSSLWTKFKGKGRGKKMASINDLRNLTQLKMLYLENNGETLSEGTLGSMTQMERLFLKLIKMESLPGDMANMSKLKTMALKCAHLTKMDSNFCKFQNLSHLKLIECLMLNELPELHKLPSLRQLEIIECPVLKKFPKEFGERGAFPSLEILSLVWSHELEELPIAEDSAMPSLQIFNLVGCEALKIFPESYLNIKTLEKIRVYGSSMALKNLENVKVANKRLEIVTMSSEDTEEFMEKYLQVYDKMEGWLYDELWNNEFSLFLRSLHYM